MTRSILYVDGFNFYYGVTQYWTEEAERETRLTGKQHKMAGLGWCDFRALVERHFMDADEELVAIKYFTSKVTAREEVPGHRRGEHVRYAEWAWAVRRINRLQVIEGFYKKDDKPAPAPHERKFQENPDAPWKNRLEKQNEVNVAVEMMLDVPHPGNTKPDKVYVLSADSDVMPAIYALEERVRPRVPVTVLLPTGSGNEQDWRHRYLETRKRLGDSFEERRGPSKPQCPVHIPVHILTKEILAQSLLPYTLRGDRSEFICRPEWQLTAKFLKQFCPNESWRPMPTE
jgi:hypothetical protein